METDKTIKIIHLQTPIRLDSLVQRAWKTYPAYQYELGRVIGVYDGDDYLLHGDIMVQWANGVVQNELYCELNHVEVKEE